MAIFHLQISIIGRSKGQSAVASSAYQSGEKLLDEQTNTYKNYTNKKEVQYKEVMLPQNAPSEFKDRQRLWNAVEQKEKRKDAQFARKLNIALPNELTREQQIAVAQEYFQRAFVAQGMAVDWALHDKGDGNPHLHAQLTMRPFTKNGKWGAKKKSRFKLDKDGQRIPVIDPKTGNQKIYRGRKKWQREDIRLEWDNPENAERWRKEWAETVNRYLTHSTIDHRSHKRIEQATGQIMPEPTIHEGYYARKIEKANPGSSWKVAKNRQIKQNNTLLMQTMQVIQKTRELIERIRQIEIELKKRLKNYLEQQELARYQQLKQYEEEQEEEEWEQDQEPEEEEELDF